MVYRALYYIVNVLIRLFYRRIHLNGLEKIDKNKTYIIISNHPNGFLEPLIMACTFPIDLHFMVRGDLFENPILNWFLRSTHQIPIFRFVDGFAKMKANKSSMGEATKTLAGGSSILVFAEGGTKAVMKCRKIQKGAAKMAFQTFDDYPEKELHILPVGINFSDWRNPGGQVIVNIGDPFLARPYYDEAVENRAKSIVKFTLDIESRMKEEVIEVDSKEGETMIKKMWDLLSVFRAGKGRISYNTSMYQPLKSLGNSMQLGSCDACDDITKLHSEIVNVPKQKYRITGIRNILTFLLAPLALVGLVFYGLPLFIGYVMRKTLVKKEAFSAPIFVIPAYVISVLMHVALFLVFGFSLGWGISFLLHLGFMICGWSLVFVWEAMHGIPRSKLSAEKVRDFEAIIRKLD